jgi:MarR family transcriptional regulator for hemolysin
VESDEITRINRALNKTSKLYRAAKARRLAALGLHPGQDVLLWVLADAEDGMTVSELAARLGIEPPTATRSLARMEHAGLFRREPVPSDRRQVRIVMTEQGRKEIAAIGSVWAELADDMFGALPPRDRALVLDALEAANDRLIGLVGKSVLADD